MNKQEKEDLIQALYDIGGCDAEDEWSRGYDDGVNAAIEVVKELKVQGKVVFLHEEKFVADWLDGLKGRISDKKLTSGAAFMVFVGQQLECLYYNEYTLINDDVEGWLLHPENKVKLLNAIDNGYEVEKEQLYYVDFINDGDVHKRLILDHENGKYNIVDWSDNLIGLVQEMFTEQEIKAIDERYWPFAVKVDGE
ncbi:DUF1642 domain-containing protein [Enterococcus faecalis]|uniref:DUF1642 domain-containing protein n=1 Tax=Enterococcus faecalis TaxID=1351 RepID=UPI00143220A5|nr:DUF1642 domain-containing protein [Enterococcus faecalis]EHA4031123.1 DUF1642 domain-containing protein [Enterococcus faecalis]EHY9169206.1 DUF1642 domain-containing protein [Enterococcus faecalis]NJJ99896.1 DUF1642 domain-containing protein [Enterococcus faecalis]